MKTGRILIAGIGNIFMGDDAFGVEAVRELLRSPLPAEVEAVDFGIRSYDLAYALGDGYDAVILVDAVARGDAAGTLYLIEPDQLTEDEPGTVENGHSLSPVAALKLARALGGRVNKLYVLGCEPSVLESENGRMDLSAPVAAAIPQAVAMLQTLAAELLSKTQSVSDSQPTIKPGDLLYEHR